MDEFEPHAELKAGKWSRLGAFCGMTRTTDARFIVKVSSERLPTKLLPIMLQGLDSLCSNFPSSLLRMLLSKR
jgi:hypothetical protein